MTTVTIQVEAYLPRTYVRDGKKCQTRRRYLTWVNVGRHRVLYHDRQVIFVRQFGSHSIYAADGTMNLAGFMRDHPAAKRIPANHRGWRVHPKSIAKLYG